MADPAIGTSDDDLLHGGSSDDILYGYSGDDTIEGRGGDDVLYGGSGDDSLFGGKGDDLLKGGSGDDLLSGGKGDDILSGGSGDDVLLGGRGDDELSGGSGDDVLSGGKGDDVLSGGSGDDVLKGGSGDDVLKGGSGDDVLVGGSGDDRLTGGSGDDTFQFAGHFGEDTVTDLRAGDTIDLTAFSGITDVSQLTITQVGNDTLITVPGSGGGSITVKGLTPAEVVSHLDVACLMRGTMVLTPDGEVPVETLAIGDEVLTVDGEAETVKWIGRRAYARPFLAVGDRIAPILFRAGSLGTDMPTRDLYVSPEHAMYVDDVLVPAKLLVNGDSIVQVGDFDRVEYFHLEFEEAQVITTNGAPSESYVETGNRRMFVNHDEFVALYGDASQAGERARRFYMIGGGSALDAIRGRLSAEASMPA